MMENKGNPPEIPQSSVPHSTAKEGMSPNGDHINVHHVHAYAAASNHEEDLHLQLDGELPLDEERSEGEMDYSDDYDEEEEGEEFDEEEDDEFAHLKYSPEQMAMFAKQQAQHRPPRPNVHAGNNRARHPDPQPRFNHAINNRCPQGQGKKISNDAPSVTPVSGPRVDGVINRNNANQRVSLISGVTINQSVTSTSSNHRKTGTPSPNTPARHWVSRGVVWGQKSKETTSLSPSSATSVQLAQMLTTGVRGQLQTPQSSEQTLLGQRVIHKKPSIKAPTNAGVKSAAYINQEIVNTHPVQPITPAKSRTLLSPGHSSPSGQEVVISAQSGQGMHPSSCLQSTDMADPDQQILRQLIGEIQMSASVQPPQTPKSNSQHDLSGQVAVSLPGNQLLQSQDQTQNICQENVVIRKVANTYRQNQACGEGSGTRRGRGGGSGQQGRSGRGGGYGRGTVQNQLKQTIGVISANSACTDTSLKLNQAPVDANQKVVVVVPGGLVASLGGVGVGSQPKISPKQTVASQLQSVVVASGCATSSSGVIVMSSSHQTIANQSQGVVVTSNHVASPGGGVVMQPNMHVAGGNAGGGGGGMKKIVLSSGQVLWVQDQNFDSGQKTVQNQSVISESGHQMADAAQCSLEQQQQLVLHPQHNAIMAQNRENYVPVIYKQVLENKATTPMKTKQTFAIVRKKNTAVVSSPAVVAPPQQCSAAGVVVSTQQQTQTILISPEKNIGTVSTPRIIAVGNSSPSLSVAGTTVASGKPVIQINPKPMQSIVLVDPAAESNALQIPVSSVVASAAGGGGGCVKTIAVAQTSALLPSTQVSNETGVVQCIRSAAPGLQSLLSPGLSVVRPLVSAAQQPAMHFPSSGANSLLTQTVSSIASASLCSSASKISALTPSKTAIATGCESESSSSSADKPSSVQISVNLNDYMEGDIVEFSSASGNKFTMIRTRTGLELYNPNERTSIPIACGQVRGGGGGNRKQQKKVIEGATDTESPSMPSSVNRSQPAQQQEMTPPSTQEGGSLSNRRFQHTALTRRSIHSEETANQGSEPITMKTVNVIKHQSASNALAAASPSQAMQKPETEKRQPKYSDDPSVYALCNNCGALSHNIAFCEACGKNFPENMKKLVKKPDAPGEKKKTPNSLLEKKAFYGTKLAQQFEPYVSKAASEKQDGGKTVNAVTKNPTNTYVVVVKTPDKTEKVGLQPGVSGVVTPTVVTRGRGRGRVGRVTRSRQPVQPVTVTISSDEEEEDPFPSLLNSIPHVEKQASDEQSNKSNSRRHRMEDSEGNVVLPEKRPRLRESRESPSPSVPDGCIPRLGLDTRSVRVGSMKGEPFQPVFFSSEGLQVDMEVDEDSIQLVIEPREIIRCYAHLRTTLPVIFIHTTPECGEKVRQVCKMSKDSGPYYDPSSSNEVYKRITILIETLQFEDKHKLDVIFQHFFVTCSHEDPILYHIDQDSANVLLAKSSPPVVGHTEHTVTLQKIVGSTMMMALENSHGTQNREIIVRLKPGEEGSEGSFTMNPSRSPSPVRPVFEGPVIKYFTYPPAPATGGITVTNEDEWCLNEGEFLNDVIIDFYLKYLINEVISEEDRKRTHIFSSFFYRRLTQKESRASFTANPSTTRLTAQQKRHARVKTWTRHVDLFSKDFIIVPINESAHWYLAIICFPGLRQPVYYTKPPSVLLEKLQAVTKANQAKSAAAKRQTESNENNSKDMKDSQVKVTEHSNKDHKDNNDQLSTSTEVREEGSEDNGKTEEDEVNVMEEVDMDKHMGGSGDIEQRTGKTVPENPQSVGGSLEEGANKVLETSSATAELPPGDESMETDDLDDSIPLRQASVAMPKIEVQPFTMAYGMEKQPCILVFDSLAGPSRSGVVRILRDYLQIEWDLKKQATEGPRTFTKDNVKGTNPKVAQQTNYSDCGVYVLQYCESFFSNPIRDFSIPMRHLQSEWFPDELVKNKRAELCQLINTLREKIGYR